MQHLEKKEKQFIDDRRKEGKTLNQIFDEFKEKFKERSFLFVEEPTFKVDLKHVVDVLKNNEDIAIRKEKAEEKKKEIQRKSRRKEKGNSKCEKCFRI
jgi:ABC-type hemin transport system ATPase subunit